MALDKTFSCFVIFLNLILVVNPDSCFDVLSVVQDNMHMRLHTYRKVSTYSLCECAAECLVSSVCLSFSYNKHIYICHLNNNNTAVTDIVPSQDFIYSDISPWPQFLSGPCSVTSCPGNSRCQVDRLNRASCVPEFQGCGMPPEVTGSRKEYAGHFLDAMASYTCDTDFMQCGSKTNTICQTTGQWENVTGLCGLYKWHNPAPETAHPLPCGPTNRVHLTVVGTPKQGALRFSVNCVSGEDILFHVDFRINRPDFINKTVVNTRLNGVWGSQITLAVMPAAVGQESTIELTLQGGVYTVVVDGDAVITFTERYSGRKPVYFAVLGDVSVKLVTLTVWH